MSTALQNLVNQPYQHGFVTEIESDVAPKGLNEDTGSPKPVGPSKLVHPAQHRYGGCGAPGGGFCCWSTQLVYHRESGMTVVVHTNTNDPTPLISRQLRADLRIVNYLKGLNHLDERLLPYITAADRSVESVPLPPSHARIVNELETQIGRALAGPMGPHPLVVQLVGDDRLGKRDVACELARRFGVEQFDLATNMLPNHALEIDGLVRLWRRESCLMPVCLYVLEPEKSIDPNARRHVHQFLEAARSLAFVEATEAQDFGENSITSDINKPTHKEQSTIWFEVLGNSVSAEEIGRLSTEFHLSGRIVRRVAQAAVASPESDLQSQLWNACRAVARPTLDSLTQRIDVKATWDDIVLPDIQMDLLRQIASQVRHRSVVYDEWGFREKMNRGLGITALFAGPSGTGKTMAAEVLANDLELDLYRVDLSAVVNKYIGETEKNLRRIFDAADDGGVILFFDEADSLFGKRTEVKDSHDRYANIEVNYLLQRMESYRGLAILATNMKSALDKAFLRRLRFIVEMPLPSAKERREIWCKAFPSQTPTSDLDFDDLAGMKLTGGNIHGIVLNAAFQSVASIQEARITMRIITGSVETEFHKLEKPSPQLHWRLSEQDRLSARRKE
jgi:hypothetical protein